LDAQVNIKWKNIDKYIETPIKGIFDFETKQTRHNRVIKFQGKQAYASAKDIDSLAQTLLPLNYDAYVLDYADAFFYEICSNSFYFNKLLYYNLVDKATIESATQNFSSKAHKQDKLFRVGFEVGGNLLNRIWLPASQLKIEIDAFVRDHFLGNKAYVIGIQLRYGSKWTAEHQSDAIFLGNNY